MEPVTKIQVGSDGILDQVVSSRGCRKWAQAGSVLKVELTTFIVGLDWGCERKRGVKRILARVTKTMNWKVHLLPFPLTSVNNYDEK